MQNKKLKTSLLRLLFGIIGCFIVFVMLSVSKGGEPDDIFPFLDKGVGHWEKTSNMVYIRNHSSSAVVMADGNVLISGGWNGKGYLNTAEIYYPKENVFRRTGDMAYKRHSHSSFLLKDGTIAILGGQIPSIECHTKDVEIYNPKTGAFTITDTLPQRLGDSLVMLDNGYICDKRICYNPLTKNIKYLPKINYDRVVSLISIGNTIYAIGGTVRYNSKRGILNRTIKPKEGEGFIITDTIEKYTFGDDKYEIVSTKLNIPKAVTGNVALPNGKILIIGGRTHKDQGTLDRAIYDNIHSTFKKYFKEYYWYKDLSPDIELFDPSNNTISTVAKLFNATGGYGVLLNDTQVFVLNGRGRRDEIIDTKTWKVLPVKKIYRKKVTSNLPIPLDKNTILFIGALGKPLPYGYIFKLNN